MSVGAAWNSVHCSPKQARIQ